MSELNKYIAYFSNLKRAPWNVVPGVTKGGAPHKPLLLLALIDLVEQGVITSSYINVDDDLDKLDEKFSDYWELLVTTGQTSSVAFPFANLDGERFWKIRKREGQEFNANSISSVSQLRKVALGAVVDEQLFGLLLDTESRVSLRNSLLGSCFSDEVQGSLSELIAANVKQVSVKEQNMNTSGIRFWVCGLGEGAKYWEECRANNTLVFGLDELPALSKYKSKDELKQAIVEEGSRGTNPYNDALAGWQFAHEIKEGDVIIAKRGTKAYLGYGIVSGPYRHDANRVTYRNIIPVTWKKTGEWLETDGKIIIKTITDITSYTDYVQRLIKLIGIDINGGVVSENNSNKLLESLRNVIADYIKQFIAKAKSDITDLSQIPIPSELSNISRLLGISFKTSFGIGASNKIPWLACFMPGQTASFEGVYPVILYIKNTMQLSVNYGVSADAKKSDGNWPKKWSDDLVSGLPHFPDKKYGESYTYKSYPSSQIDSLEEITDSFIKVISDYIHLNKTGPLIPESKKASMELTKISVNAMGDFKNANLRFQQSTVIRYVSALLTKPFTILTGLTGSGKTKLAEAFALWLTENPDFQIKMIPVGADWTNREPLLGFPNALQPGRYVKPDSGALELILNALANPGIPHFLILDEMNMSHVERYYADFLSAMESAGRQIYLHPDTLEWKDKDGNWNDGVPSTVVLPKNLFIIGTVNIDETTYMFSPKVLDRAQVIEFRVSKEEMEEFLKNPAPVDMDQLKGKGSFMGVAFVAKAVQPKPVVNRH